MKLRRLSVLALSVLLLAAAALLGFEFHWRAGHELLKPQAAAPDGSLVAEVRSLPTGRQAASTGVYVRGRWEYLRALRPRLVFAGSCEAVETRWFGDKRLVIECEHLSGEPRLLRDMVDGVVIELVVNRRFA